jgi:DNA polymerase-3 subunit epsilon
VADELLDYLQGAEVIIHNAAFDVSLPRTSRVLALIGKPAVLASFVGSVTDTLLHGASEMYPGKRQQPGRACATGWSVDNSATATLHGALLDAELLADVYINLTRGQDALLIDVSAQDASGVVAVRMDLSRFDLPVIAANDQEAAAHDDVLKQLDKASGGKTLWRVKELAAASVA